MQREREEAMKHCTVVWKGTSPNTPKPLVVTATTASPKDTLKTHSTSATVKHSTKKLLHVNISLLRFSPFPSPPQTHPSNTHTSTHHPNNAPKQSTRVGRAGGRPQAPP